MALPQGLLVAVDVLGVVLLHFLWQGALVGLAYAALKPLGTNPLARYRLGLFALAILALAPLLTAVVCWPGSVIAADSGSTVLASTLQAGADVIVHGQIKPLLPWLVALWMAGVVVIAGRSLWQWRRLMRLVRSAEPASPEWQLRLLRLCERFQLHRPVRLLYSATATTPMLLGWLKPVILLPASMLSGFTPHQIEMIIAHELGHIRRFDYLVNLVQVAIETVLFYHPVVHWISSDVRNAREACCDDLALQVAGGSRLAYARALADLEELRLAAPALGAGGGVLLARIKRIVGETDEPLPRSYALPLVLVCAALVTLVWHPRSTPELRAALDRLPAQALALLSKTSFRVERPALSLSLPRPDVQPVRANPVLQSVPVLPPPVENHVSAPPPPVPVVPALDAPRAEAASVPPAVREPVSAPIATVDPASGAAKASPLRVIPPAYPARARAEGIEGAVKLEYTIEGDGTIGQIKILSAHPAGVFDEAAKAALRSWLYPVSSAGEKRVQNFAFTLHGQSRAEDPCETPTGTLICRRPSP